MGRAQGGEQSTLSPMTQPSGSETPDQNWESYVAFQGDAPLVVQIDLAVKQEQLRRDLTDLVRVELEVIAPDDHGQPSEMEDRQLVFEADQLADLLDKHATGGRLIASTTYRATRELVLALPEAGRADYALRKWTRKLERECEIQPLEGGWEFVDRHLLPGQAERDWMAARDAVLEALEQGLVPGAPTRLLIEGQPPREVPLDPFAIAAELAEARAEDAPTPDWQLECPK